MAFMEELERDHLIELALRCVGMSRSLLCVRDVPIVVVIDSAAVLVRYIIHRCACLDYAVP